MLQQEYDLIFNTEDWSETSIECECRNGTPLEEKRGCGGSQLCGSCDEGYELYNNLCLPTEEVESLSSSCLTEIKDTDYFFMMENSVSVLDLDFQTSVDAAERFFRGISFSENSDNDLVDYIGTAPPELVNIMVSTKWCIDRTMRMGPMHLLALLGM